MRYFRLMRSGIDIAPLLAEVKANEDAWLVKVSRQEKIHAQRETNSIVLRNSVNRPDLSNIDNQESEYTAISKRFPLAVEFMNSFAREMNAEVSRSTIVRLKPKSRVYSHIDWGTYYFIRDRYHLVLHSTAGSILNSGGEQVRMHEGELWWFDNKQHHDALNESNEWRIHYIFDLLPETYRHLGVNPAMILSEGEDPIDVTKTEPKGITARGHAQEPVKSSSVAAPAPAVETSSWTVGRKDIVLDKGILKNVKEAVGHANKKFKETFLNPVPATAPYLFDVVPAGQVAPQPTAMTAAAQPSALLRTPPADALLPPPSQESIRAFIFDAIRDNAIVHSTPERRLISPVGTDHKWLMDMRRIFMDSRMLNAVAELFWRECESLLPFQVGGMEVAAIPLVAAILMKGVERGTPVNGFIVRKERKSYGQGRLYEGSLTNDPILIVDDLINSGDSLEKIRVVMATEGKTISHVFVLVDYEGLRGISWRQRHRVNVMAPFKVGDFGLSVERPGERPLLPLFSEMWNFVSPDPNFWARVPKSFPVTDGQRVYFGSDCGYMWALNALDGSVVWRFHVHSKGHKNIWSAPALHEGRLYFGAYDGNVYCLDAATGKEIWRFQDADWIGSSPALAPDIGMLFIGLEFSIEGQRGAIIGLDITTGERVWEYKNKRYTHASPAYWKERGLVACGSNDNEMFLFEAKTGKMIWRFETRADKDKGSIRHAPAFDAKRNQLITGCANGYIYIIDIETGKEVWSVKTSNTIYTIPLVVGDLAFVGSTDKNMYVLDLEKKVVKRKLYCDSKIFGPPRLLDGAIFFGACNGNIYQLDPATGDITGKYQLPDAITCALTYSPETSMFYALTYVNQLFALVRAPAEA